jgi:hypothetical protein
MTQFHEGQDVEVFMTWATRMDATRGTEMGNWRKAKIVYCQPVPPSWRGKFCLVQFPNRRRDMFAADHIRTTKEQANV